MAIQNVIGDAFRGATWVAIHNGGGVGWYIDISVILLLFMVSVVYVVYVHTSQSTNWYVFMSRFFE